MIYEALHVVVDELNNYLINMFLTPDKKAILGTILNQDGTVPEPNLNKIILSLINLEYETTVQYASAYTRTNNTINQFNTPYNFNIDLLITSLFTDYDESLKFLSETIYFFQSKRLFTHENTPDLDSRINQLSFEIVKVTYHEAHSLWTALGAKYTPSVIFKIRMLSFQGSQSKPIPAIRNTKPTTDLK